MEEKYKEQMILWARENNLETELYEEILNSPQYKT